MTTGGFNIFTELENWATQLDLWQQCALSKLINRPELTDEDYQVILRELMWDKGLDAPPEKRVRYPLGTPAAKAGATPQPKLSAIKSVVGVNALAPNQRLDIGPQLTVVYGPKDLANQAMRASLRHLVLLGLNPSTSWAT